MGKQHLHRIADVAMSRRDRGICDLRHASPEGSVKSAGVSATFRYRDCFVASLLAMTFS